MLININCAKCIGIEAVPVTVEVDVITGIGIHLVGLADTAIRESLLRTMTALQALGYRIPGKRIVINLAPADMHKRGSCYDLAIALGILAASGQIEAPRLGQYMIMGELGLDGTIRPIDGALPIVELAKKDGLMACILPYQSALETVEFDGIDIFAVNTLEEVIMIVGEKDASERMTAKQRYGIPAETAVRKKSFEVDFEDIIGQEAAKRGVEIAAAGGHNVLLIGPPGSGKSSIGKAMAGILPSMSFEESLQTSKIYSVAGKGNLSYGLIKARPFRSPHYTASATALLGGGTDNILPGEISLAHNGILFIDEFCEAPQKTLEMLRAPMEDRKIVISRLKAKVEYPSDFILVAATNPCPCGHYGDGDRCSCTPARRTQYLSKLSGPLMDRIDIHLWVSAVNPGTLMQRRKAESSAIIAARVEQAREIQKRRFAGEGIFCNAAMNNKLIDKYCHLSEECRKLLEKIVTQNGFSARACFKIIRLARTIADLEASEEITAPHISEACTYRFLDKTYF